MIKLTYLPIIGALVLLTACAENGSLPQLSQADLDKQAALTACKAEADTYNRPLDNGDVQLFSLPGTPAYPGPQWQASRDRTFGRCMAGKGYADYKANAS